MDNLYISTTNAESAGTIKNSKRECLSFGGYKLTKWNSNFNVFLKNVANENLLRPDLPSLQPQKGFGLTWNASTDEYIIEKRPFRRIPNDQFTTQRKNLKSVASVFDSLGVIAPLTIRVKILESWSKTGRSSRRAAVLRYLHFKYELPSYEKVSTDAS